MPLANPSSARWSWYDCSRRAGPALYTMITRRAGDGRSRRVPCAAACRRRRIAPDPSTPDDRPRSPMARPLVRADQPRRAALAIWRACARRRRGTQVLAVVKANAYGHGLHARAAGARGGRRPGAGRARCRDRACASAHYTRRILLLEGFFDGARAAGDRAAPARRCRARRGAGADARDARCSSRPLEVFVKVNTGMNRLGFAPDEVAGVLRAAVDARRRWPRCG